MKSFPVAMAFLAASVFTPAQAAVVTFDDAAAPTGGYFAGESFSDSGLTFTYSPSGTDFMQLYDANLGAAPGSNGTKTLLVGAASSDYVTITATGGGLFSISSLLLGISEPAIPETSDTVLINGVSQSITNTATIYAVNARNVSAVTVSALQAGGFVSIDNITYQVLEPLSLAVLGAGLGAVALTRRRRPGAATS